jgi:hypothetical protein
MATSRQEKEFSINVVVVGQKYETRIRNIVFCICLRLERKFICVQINNIKNVNIRVTEVP